MIYRVKYLFESDDRIVHNGRPTAVGGGRVGGYSYHGSLKEVAHVIREWTVIRDRNFAKGILDTCIPTPHTKKEILALLNEYAGHPDNDTGW